MGRQLTSLRQEEDEEEYKEPRVVPIEDFINMLDQNDSK